MWFCENQDFSRSTKDKRILCLDIKSSNNIVESISTIGRLKYQW